MYFTYNHAAGNWLANPDLEAEQALNQSIHLQAEHQLGSFGLNLYHTRYKNFLYEQESTYKKRNQFYDPYSAGYGQLPYYTTIAQQAVNLIALEFQVWNSPAKLTWSKFLRPFHKVGNS